MSQKGKSLTTYGQTLSIKDQVFAILNKLPNAKPKAICKLLSLEYVYYRDTVKTYRHDWKKSKSNFRQGLNRLTFHAPRIYGYVFKQLDRKISGLTDEAVDHGWLPTQMRNRALQWKDLRLGRLLWFETGRVIGQMKKPTNKGKIMQLLSNAFYGNGLIDDVVEGISDNQKFQLFHQFADSFKLKGSHLVYETGEVLPYARIELLKLSNGVIVTIGDKSHPTGVEIEFCYPDWAERLEILQEQNIKTIENFSKLMESLSQPKPLTKNGERMVS